MGHRYYICDVFTDTRFGGNQLAVLPEAHGLSDRQMQQVAREFTVTFEEKAGLVPIAIHRRQGTLWCQLSAPERLSLGKTVPADVVAAAVSLAPDDVVLTTHQPQVASVGLPFLVTELKDRSALERARVSGSGVDALVARGIVPDVHLYTRSGDEFEIRARGFAPFDGVPEDPAPGSASCALAGLLSHLGPRPARPRGASPRVWRWDGRVSWKPAPRNGAGWSWPLGSAERACW